MELLEDLINLPVNVAQNTLPVNVEELQESVKSDLYHYQNLNAIMESYKDVTVTIKAKMNMRKNLSDLNAYLDKVENQIWSCWRQVSSCRKRSPNALFGG